MRAGRALAAAAALAGAAGCASSNPGLTKTQQDALQVRDVDASMDRAFAAATDAVIDAGYTVDVTDGEGGLLTAVRREDPSVAKNAAVLTISTLLTMGYGPMKAESRLYGVGVQVLPRTGGLSSVRIRPYGMDDLESERREIAHLWALMQRHVMLKEPAPAGPPG